MTSTMPSQPAGEQLQNANTNGGGLDVDWLIHKKGIILLRMDTVPSPPLTLCRMKIQVPA